MNTTTKILAINGSYRENGVTDQVVAVAAEALRASGASVETVELRNCDIDFCQNCRACTQQAGEFPSPCVIDDRMANIVKKIENADAYVIAAPTNFGSVTAVFKRFAERLLVYAYWPWGATGPKYRKQHLPKKKALLVTSCAAPGWMGRLLYETPKQLKYAAKTIGAKPVGAVFPGLVSAEAGHVLSGRTVAKTKRMAKRLLH